MDPAPAGARSRVARPEIAFVVDDLVDWVREGRQPTGIQRVASELILTAAARTDVRIWPGITTADPRRASVVEIDPDRLKFGVGGQAVALPPPRSSASLPLRLAKRLMPWALRLRLRAVERRARDVARSLRDAPARWRRAPAGSPVDLLVLADAFWPKDLPSRISRLTARGIPLRVIVYDLIPIKHPEWFGPAYTGEFIAGLDALLPRAERIVTLSAEVAGELEARYPGSTVVLAVPDLAAHAPRTDAIPFSGPPFLLAPGTVEPRKNHRLILDAWTIARQDERLAEARLVICGRRGWQTDDIEAEIERDRDRLNLARIDDASDEQLEGLYQASLGTIHASVVEGFGLPVRESVVRGLPTLVAATIPRDGLPDGAYDVFNPGDPQELAGLMVDLVANPRPRTPIQVGSGTGWEPVLSALID